MSSNDFFDLDITVTRGGGDQASPDTWTTTRTLVTKVTCRSCTCLSCITQCPLSCW